MNFFFGYIYLYSGVGHAWAMHNRTAPSSCATVTCPVCSTTLGEMIPRWSIGERRERERERKKSENPCNYLVRINAIPSAQHIYRIPQANFHGAGGRCRFHFYVKINVFVVKCEDVSLESRLPHYAGINGSVWDSAVLNSINSCCLFISCDCLSHTCNSYFCWWTGNHLTSQSMHCSASIRRKTVIVFEIINYKFAIWKHVKFSIWNIHTFSFVHERNEVN